MSEFVAMSGYGLYVWGSYGVTLLVILWEVLAVRVRRRAALAKVARMHDAQTAQP